MALSDAFNFVSGLARRARWHVKQTRRTSMLNAVRLFISLSSVDLDNILVLGRPFPPPSTKISSPTTTNSTNP